MNSKKFIALITAAVLVIGSMSAAYGDSPFGDIENNWAKANIISVYEKGLMNGTSEGKFSPNSPVSKYSAVITIARMMNAEKTEDLDAYIEKYKDILDKYSVPSYARREVAFCLDKEIIQGEIDLVRFNEEPNATKLDICIYLGRAFGIKHDPSQPSAQLFFRDTEMIPRAYRIYVDHMIKIEVVDGKGDANGDFRPNDPLTRAMFAKMIDVANTEYTNEFGQGSETSPSVEDENEEEPSKEITDKIDYISDTATSTIAKGTIDSIIYSRSSKPKILLEVEGKKIMEFFMPITSALIGPSTMDAISITTCLKSRPSLAIKEGLVVTPEIIPISFALIISSTFAVSIKSFTINTSILIRTMSYKL